MKTLITMLVLASSLMSQVVNITGRVVNEGAKPIPGTVIHLTTLDLKDTSDVDGKFHISADITALNPFSQSEGAVWHVNKGQLFFYGLEKNQSLRVSLNNIKGERVTEIIKQEVTASVGKLDLMSHLNRELTAGIYFLSIHYRKTHKVVPLFVNGEKGMMTVGQNSLSKEEGSFLRKTSAALDSIVITHLTKAPYSANLATYTKDFGDVVLKGKEGQVFSLGDSPKFRQFEYNFRGRRTYVVLPDSVKKGTPWVWRARFWKHKPNMDIELLKAGYHLVYTDVIHLYGGQKALEQWDAFYAMLTEYHGFNKKPALEGMSRGGLIIFNWAIRNANKVSAIYADAPVCDFKSWPGGFGTGRGSGADWNRLLKIYEFENDDVAKAYTKNPIDTLGPLAAAKVPLLHVIGDADNVVPVAENTGIIETRYKALGGSIQVIVKPGVGHKHGLADPKPIVDFILGAYTP